ncbi:MAG: endopeptidase La [Ectothiorhodospiraceae bacterium]|nr:endopeptidase La [Chromatiales bacterium]MCP5154570.1 endopeptidase La [Ectothiorhodospiraceae bacterium]
MSDGGGEQPEVLGGAGGTGGGTLAVAADILPSTLHVLPLTVRPFFPIQAMPILLDEERWLPTVQALAQTPQRLAALVLLRPDAGDTPGPDAFHAVGTVARVHNAQRGNGRIQLVAEGIRRVHIERMLTGEPPYVARVRYLDDDTADTDEETRAYAMAIVSTLKELLPLNPLYNEELKAFLERFTPSQPAFLTYFAANLTSAASGEELQAVLEQASLKDRMGRVLELLKKELDLAKLQSQIHRQVEEKLGRQQREFFLREQLKVIQKELGLSKDDRTADIERFRERLRAREPSPAAAERVERELEKLAILETGSPEYGVTRNYLDWLTGLPWGVRSDDVLDLEHAREVLDADHTGLEDVKDRIVELLAVGKLRGNVTGSILLLVGPPGVGKTSIGRSIARALGRRFYRFSLGGMRDEAEIKGHRRTYVGAMPGKFVQALKDVEVANPVLMLDEIDKVGASYHGDPASALLEALDPEQNVDFLDHYLDVRFDLSQVLFVCTANQLDTIPGPLLDRMEVIRLSGYIAAEKVAIARDHLWPRQLERAGIRAGKLAINDRALGRLVEDYAREAGVRGLDKQLGRIVRKAAVAFVRGERRRIRVGPRDLEDYLGKPLFRRERESRGVGVVNGLAWTALGGATLAVEATVVHAQSRGLKLTGQLGEVMRESADIAYSHVGANVEALGGPAEFFASRFVHVHVPEGATPKDGPSAGITMATALLSLARGRAVRRGLAMTGELTLTGKVLAVGGIREKVIAARRARLMELVLPEANRADVEALPEHLREGLTVHFAAEFADVERAVFPPRGGRGG